MLSFFSFIFGLTVIEGILKPIFVFYTQRSVRKYAPKILNELDKVLPVWIAEYTERELQEKCIDLIFTVGKEVDGVELPFSEAEKILKSVVTDYSFLVNAKTFGVVDGD